ncbi:OmpA family protein [Sorangium sp. So ce1000]|uniref:OmpA family protein n=1 Tax=Sorangium sp. So ce1000 TaxID=3133325 RepID=UPI003F62B2B9
MDSKRKQAGRTSLPFALAAAMFAGQGCSDNRLPPRELPRVEEQRTPPSWFGKETWSEQGGESLVYIEGKIVFDTNKATIRPGSEGTLKELLGFLRKHSEVTRLRIEGHTDAQSSEDHNQELSAQRALAVAEWLVKNEVESTRLIAVGFGESRPLGPNEIAAGRSENRRVEFHVAEVNGRPFLGKDPYAGGRALEVLSPAERKLREAKAAQLKAPPPRKGFVATGDEIKQVPVKPRPPAGAQEGEPPAPSAPAKEGAPAKGGAAPAGGG